MREMALKWYRAAPDGVLPVDPSLRPLVGWALRDIPTVRKALNAPVSVALLKGRANYLCHFHLERTLQNGRLTTLARTARHVRAQIESPGVVYQYNGTRGGELRNVPMSVVEAKLGLA